MWSDAGYLLAILWEGRGYLRILFVSRFERKIMWPALM